MVLSLEGGNETTRLFQGYLRCGGGVAVCSARIQRAFFAAGGLISYGPNFSDQYRRAAKALGFTVLPSLLTRADEVIE